MDKKEYIKRLADFLVSNGTTMTGENLADHLNWNNFKTSYNTTYAGSRGTYTLIHATYDWLVSQGDQWLQIMWLRPLRNLMVLMINDVNNE